MSGQFVKLYGSILTSSVWAESKETRLVWITMLAMADKEGRVDAAIPGLAHAARVTVAECEEALRTFMQPDTYSRTKENDGRRIDEVDGGWVVLNHEKYRDIRTDKQMADAERQRRHRERTETLSESVTCHDCHSDVATDADAYTDTTTPTPPPPAQDDLEAVASLFPKPAAASAMLIGMTNGLGTAGMKAVPVDVLQEAAVELSASGGDVTPHRYKVFVTKIMERRERVIAENPRSRNDGVRSFSRNGKTLAAGKLIQKVRESRNPQFPNSVLPDWRNGLTDSESEIVKAFGIPRILNDANEGTLISQLAKALEEVA